MMENYKSISAEELDQRQKKFVWDYLRDHELLDSQENVICAPKAFVVNAVFRWAAEKVQNKQMTTIQWAKIKRMLAQYIADVVEIEWHEGKVKAIEAEDGKRRQRKKRR